MTLLSSIVYHWIIITITQKFQFIIVFNNCYICCVLCLSHIRLEHSRKKWSLATLHLPFIYTKNKKWLDERKTTFSPMNGNLLHGKMNKVSSISYLLITTTKFTQTFKVITWTIWRQNLFLFFRNVTEMVAFGGIELNLWKIKFENKSPQFQFRNEGISVFL